MSQRIRHCNTNEKRWYLPNKKRREIKIYIYIRTGKLKKNKIIILERTIKVTAPEKRIFMKNCLNRKFDLHFSRQQY